MLYIFVSSQFSHIHVHVHVRIYSHSMLPYSGKFSRRKIFEDLQFSKFHRNNFCGCHKCHA